MLCLHIRLLDLPLVPQAEEIEWGEGYLDPGCPVEDIWSEARRSTQEGARGARSGASSKDYARGAEYRDIAPVQESLLSLLLQAKRVLLQHDRVICCRRTGKIRPGKRREESGSVDRYLSLS
jgi:hypothetical protein